MNGYSGRRMFMGKPGVYARKDVSPTTEVHIPFLQAAICCLVILGDVLLILSWGLILPTGIIYATSIIAITALIPTVIAGLFFGFRKVLDWMGVFPKVLAVMLSPVQLLRLFIRAACILLCYLTHRLQGFVRKRWPRIDKLLSKFLMLAGKLCQPIDRFLSDLPGFIEKHWTSMTIAIAMIAFLVTGVAFIVHHNAWHDVCVSLPHIDLPLPNVGGHSEPILGFFLICIGVIGFAFRPGRYSLGMAAFGGIVTFCLQYFRPMTIKVTYGWTLPLYAIWGAICFAWLVGTATLLIRFWLRDLLEFSDYPDQRAPDPFEKALDPDPENRSGRGGQEGY